MPQTSRESALRLLDKIRAPRNTITVDLEFMRRHLEEGSLTLADIGTTEDEIETLRVLGCKIAAIGCLEFLRENNGYPRGQVRNISLFLEEGGLTFTDIGTTEEEFEKLRLRNYERYASNCLERLRDHSGDVPVGDNINSIRWHINECGLTLADIGTTEEELGDFAQKAA